ncbi:MAG TPA: sugar phosphate nucleotidyltransferase [Bacteroidia bacterium]|jgi:glucose-1-phosphate thymidylyltransferase|nr:sugar phosphate nucleotidyltransferase [Bacteroidia bacterium]
MKIIIPMAGMGKRMRPHTLTTPKPLIPIAGKSIVQRLVEDIVSVSTEKVDEIAFVIGRFGKETEESLKKIAIDLKAKASIYYQDQALGTAHAILCAKEALNGKVIIAFADTLFKADFKLDDSRQGIIWVQKVADPKPFGVVKLNEKNIITDFVEKPDMFVSDLAIIGIYYFKDGYNLRKELEYLIENNIKDKGEYQLTNALENMKNKGVLFSPGKVTEWLDCGNKDSTVYTNQRILEFNIEENLVSKTHSSHNSVIIEPCYIGENVKLINSIVGPHVSIGKDSVIEDSIIKNSIVQNNSKISTANIRNSMFGNCVDFKNHFSELSMGDYSVQHAKQ